jgi:ubiquinone/menaquinone biosynthesis C-methylase UbiE
MANILRAFQDPDPVATAALIEWLDNADRLPPIQEIKGRMRDVRPAQPGEHILDVGCGVGHEVRRLAEVTGHEGRAVGIDTNQWIVSEAERRTVETPGRAEFRVGDAQSLEFANESFDMCRAERVLRYVEDPGLAVREMARVVRPGGHVLIFDFDSDQTVVDMPDRVLARSIAEVVDETVPNPWIGRQLLRHCLQAGLIVVAVLPQAVLLRSPQLPVYRRLVGSVLSEAVECGKLQAGQVAAWWDWLEAAEARGEFFTATFGFVVLAAKP